MRCDHSVQRSSSDISGWLAKRLKHVRRRNMFFQVTRDKPLMTRVNMKTDSDRRKESARCGPPGNSKSLDSFAPESGSGLVCKPVMLPIS